jgi:hypothetical protein
VKGVRVSAMAPNEPTSASGSDMSTANGRVSEANSIIISMYISSMATPRARKMSLKAEEPWLPWPE